MIDVIRAGRLDEAEHAAQDLLEQYPEVTTVSNALRWSTPPAVTARVPQSTTAKRRTSSTPMPTSTIPRWRST